MDTRRAILSGLIAALAVAPFVDAEAQPARRRTRRRTRRRVRRRVRRRIRRRVRRRTVAGVSLLVVPVGMAVGWELMVDNTVYVVKNVTVVNGQESVVLVSSSGKTITEPILREDTADNSVELEGSQLPDSDTTTPGIEVEIEVEVDG